VRLYRNGWPDPDIERVIFANVRTPAEREGDLRAPVAANRRGSHRLEALVRRQEGAGYLVGAADYRYKQWQRLGGRNRKRSPEVPGSNRDIRNAALEALRHRSYRAGERRRSRIAGGEEWVSPPTFHA
jgi:hypothetical protein